jgi:N-acetylglucosamine kinase-like BadF-type ATPase
LGIVQEVWARFEVLGADLHGATGIGIGIAGFASAADTSRALLVALAGWRPDLRHVLAGDATTSHAGALGGRPGVVLAVGTGSVALAVRADGGSAIVDGWGFVLGDEGSGYAVGRAGLVAGLRHADGRGGSAELLERAVRAWGPVGSLPRMLYAQPNLASAVAAFAPEVAAAAVDGDQVARGIWVDAARALVATATAAAAQADPAAPVAVTGGLLDVGEVLTAPLDELWEAAHGARRPLQPAQGDAVSGAALLVSRDDLPHAALTMRHEPAGTG